MPVPKVSISTTPARSRPAPKRISAIPAASASFRVSTVPGMSASSPASTSVPIHDLSTFAAVCATPFFMTPGNVTPTRSVHPNDATIPATAP
jgi:hypothetical protein